MRPRKRILLIDADDDRRGEFKFVLEVRGYRVIQHARGDIDLIIARWPIAAGSCKRLSENNPYTPLLILHSPMALTPQMPLASLVMPIGALGGNVEVLERIHALSARKRGPRKGSRKPAQTATPEPAATAAIA